MSIPDSAPKAVDSLAAQAEGRFLGVDHVGVVRHFEGVELESLASAIRTILEPTGAKFEEATEKVRGRVVYTNVATLPGGDLILWATATLVEPVGCVLDAKIFHATDQSAEADERLSRIIDKISETIHESSV